MDRSVRTVVFYCFTVVLAIVFSSCTTHMPIIKVGAAPPMSQTLHGIRIAVDDYETELASMSYTPITYGFLFITNMPKPAYTRPQMGRVLAEITEFFLMESRGFEKASLSSDIIGPSLLLKPRLVKMRFTKNPLLQVTAILQPFLFIVPLQRVTGVVECEYRLYDQDKLIWAGFYSETISRCLWVVSMFAGEKQMPYCISLSNDRINSHLVQDIYNVLSKYGR